MTGPAPAAKAKEEAGQGGPCEGLLPIGAAAARAGVTERSLRYYQELGLLSPSAVTKGGMRRYSQQDLDRVARIRELQTLLGFNLDEVARVLSNEDRVAEIKARYHSPALPATQRRKLAEESLELALELRRLVDTKKAALDAFITDLDSRIARIRAAIEES